MMAVSGMPEEPGARVPAIPERCPRCDGRGFNRDRETFFRGIVRSPVRAHTMGTAVGGQILVDRLIDSLGTHSAAARTIVFTDSRDDAAATAAGLEMNHFRDLLRQLIRVEARARRDPVALVRDAAADRDVAEEHRPLLEQLKTAHPDVWAAYRLEARGVAADDDLVRIAAFERTSSRERSVVPWGLLLGSVEGRLVELGVNPAGPQPSRGSWYGESWWRLFAPPDGRAWEPLDEETAKPGAERFRRHLAAQIAGAVFDRAGRDFEAIGLGVVFPRTGDAVLPGLARSVTDEVLASAVRILGLAQQFEDSPRMPADRMPARLRDYLHGVAARHSVSVGDLEADVATALRSAGVVNERFQLATSGAGAPFALRLRDGGMPLLRCENCARIHINPSAGVLHESDVPFDRVGSRQWRWWRGLLRVAVGPETAPDAGGGTHRTDETYRGAAPAPAPLQRRAVRATCGERPEPWHRRAKRYDDDGGRCRHRLAWCGRTGQHASTAVQLPATRGARGTFRTAVLLRGDNVPRPYPRQLLFQPRRANHG